ncbi:DUF4189 domain-containing protein [Pseudomonas sp. Irchel 3A5]|jgi:hypothetical protein|uniref:DUF4189 domain-containing protein n=1 Tax=Pseudomonas sp. Irchel 3A5 TaxID=2008911 RepID=UPI000BA42EFF|nr:DUF4189 domain-containing protein [Pseudomonas sp. Irchel 3A5]
MFRTVLLSFLFLLMTSHPALAQTACPIGVAPGSPQCGLDPGNSKAESLPPRPTGEWITTWGAIAGTDDGAGGWPSSGKLSKNDAEQNALKQCRDEGVSNCKVLISYHNQCVAVVAPSSGRGENGIASAKTEDLAAEAAFKNCRNDRRGECSVIYSNCTKAVFKKY